ncbi:hydantoinase/oxoprolinase N-terminal domain-containing protein [Spirillospora sp. CA-294931]|uniref:hydantoinase/oxoprolinase N-terminal domain-containing protein n=1 Tax=Spirillospora sp. CA-294931 TaxID=3240042 RepID=UPI003D926215
MLVGVDVGATDAGAVLTDGREVLTAVTGPAAPSFADGVAGVLRELVRADPRAATARAVTVGTAGFETAVAEARGLARTGCVRLCATEAESAPPLSGWPAALRGAVGEHAFPCGGGHEFDGRPLRPLDEDELGRIAGVLSARGIDAVAITSVFSPVNGRAELAAAAFLRDRLPTARISVSHEIGSIGLLERENATIVNAALLPLADGLAAALAREVEAVIPDASVHLVQNDGTVMELSFARRYPVFTFWAGFTCAVRGAALLSGHADCVVVDVGAATTTVGVAGGGYPRHARQDVDLAGVRTNLPRPEAVELATGTPDAAQLDEAVLNAVPGAALPVVLVGPGGNAVPASFEALRPERGELARAVGAAGTRIGGEVDRIVSGDPEARRAAVERAKSLAAQKAVMAGAAEATVRVIEVEEMPLAYLPGDFVRLRVKAVGDLG